MAFLERRDFSSCAARDEIATLRTDRAFVGGVFEICLPVPESLKTPYVLFEFAEIVLKI